MTSKPINNDMDMLSSSTINNLPDATQPQQPITKAQLDATLSYYHTQMIASAVWTINHNMKRYPAVTVIDSGGSTVIGQVAYTTLNQCVVTFVAAFSGTATLT